jgi:hypothetical protein
LKEDQLQNAATLKEMSEEGMKDLREALKNPTLSEEVLKEWSKTMREMQNIAGKPMPTSREVARAGGQAAEGQGDQDAGRGAGEPRSDILQDLATDAEARQ